MSDESCTCGCSTEPTTEATEDCTCGCGRGDEKESKEDVAV